MDCVCLCQCGYDYECALFLQSLCTDKTIKFLYPEYIGTRMPSQEMLLHDNLDTRHPVVAANAEPKTLGHITLVCGTGLITCTSTCVVNGDF
mgnify:CR=1 FL=1